MNTKTQKILYWISTGVFAAMMLMSAVMYLTKNAQIIDGFSKGGLPLYLIPLLGILKASGSVALLVTAFPRIKEWAYAGFAFNLIGATWVHVSTQTPFVGPLIFLLVLSASYYLNEKLKQVSPAKQ